MFFLSSKRYIHLPSISLPVGVTINHILLLAQSERFVPTEGFNAALDYHGADGPLVTSVHPLAPISAAVVESYIDKGVPYKEDMFVEGEGEGVGHVTRTVYDGLRTGGLVFPKWIFRSSLRTDLTGPGLQS